MLRECSLPACDFCRGRHCTPKYGKLPQCCASCRVISVDLDPLLLVPVFSQTEPVPDRTGLESPSIRHGYNHLCPTNMKMLMSPAAPGSPALRGRRKLPASCYMWIWIGSFAHPLGVSSSGPGDLPLVRQLSLCWRSRVLSVQEFKGGRFIELNELLRTFLTGLTGFVGMELQTSGLL